MSWKGRLARAANRLLRSHDMQIVRGTDLWRPTSQLSHQPSGSATAPATEAVFLKIFRGSDTDLQDGFDFAVVMSTDSAPHLDFPPGVR